MRQKIDQSKHRMICIAIFLVAIPMINPPTAQGFVQKAVDKLLDDRNCVRCDLRGANLSAKNLRAAHLMGAYLIGTNLSGSNLAGADLRGAWLTRANLKRANLHGADLRGARLVGADMAGANLRMTDFRDASLAGANLTGARLKEANFLGATLHSAKFNQVLGLMQKQIEQACGNAETIVPPGIEIPKCSENIQRVRREKL
mgnify:CR=1 FL=1